MTNIRTRRTTFIQPMTRTFPHFSADGGDAEAWWANNGAQASENLYWQLYKSLASFKMAEAREEREGFRYDWVVRTRFDLAWTRPLPPIRAFATDSVWFGISFW